MSDQRLQRRHGVYYYRRRVPLDLVEKFGKKIVQLSLHTTNPTVAKKQRTLRDLEWDARFEAARATKPTDAVDKQSQTAAAGGPLDESACLELVRAYVERHDGAARKREAQWYPITVEERREMQIDAEVEAQSLRAREDLQHQWVHRAGTEALKAVGKSFDDPDVPGELFTGFEQDIKIKLAGSIAQQIARRGKSGLGDDLSHARSYALCIALLKAGKELPVLGTIFTVEGSLLDEVNAILQTLREETYDLLIKKWSAVERVAQALMSRDLLDQDELDRLIDGASIGDRKL